MRRRVITISQTTGAASDDVARVAAARLGFRHVDEEIIEAVAERQGLDPAVVADVERRRSFLEAFWESLDSGDAPEIAAVAYGGGYVKPSPEGVRKDYAPLLRELIRTVVHETALRGDVVIGSHAASFALAGRDDVLRVLVTASIETRVRRTADARELDEEQASRLVTDSDAGRMDYLKRFYRVDRELPTHYDLIVNTDSLDADEAVALVVRAASG
ncbi:MAG: cytidylate kinase-like family protein [Thermoleophilia bacterium]|nr:cytidylate kinase-like family protein [Thermoleophilia bacterium]